MRIRAVLIAFVFITLNPFNFVFAGKDKSLIEFIRKITGQPSAPQDQLCHRLLTESRIGLDPRHTFPVEDGDGSGVVPIRIDVLNRPGSRADERAPFGYLPVSTLQNTATAIHSDGIPLVPLERGMGLVHPKMDQWLILTDRIQLIQDSHKKYPLWITSSGVLVFSLRNGDRIEKNPIRIEGVGPGPMDHQVYGLREISFDTNTPKGFKRDSYAVLILGNTTQAQMLTLFHLGAIQFRRKKGKIAVESSSFHPVAELVSAWKLNGQGISSFEMVEAPDTSGKPQSMILVATASQLDPTSTVFDDKRVTAFLITPPTQQGSHQGRATLHQRGAQGLSFIPNDLWEMRRPKGSPVQGTQWFAIHVENREFSPLNPAYFNSDPADSPWSELPIAP